jgi:uncharacterized membrane protein YjgN (DUF898 family)
MDTKSGVVSPARNPSARAPEQLRFSGSGTEYFGIWIVNLLLSVVTIGIYSAWAKVRRLQYFYRHTELAGSSFDFHGTAGKILMGRVIALVLLFAYNFSVRLRSPLTLVVLIGLAIVMPWLLRNSLRFRLYNSSWRGTRFHFRGSVGGSYRVFLLNGFLTLITLYTMAPFMHQRLKAYQHDNTWFGRARCSFHATAGQFYGIYLLLLAAIVVVAVVIGASGIGGAFLAVSQAQKHGGHVNSYAVFKALGLLYGVFILVGLSIGPAFHALITNLIWNNTRIGEHRIECTMSPYVLIWITVSNFVLVVLTVGLFIPWAMVRLARFQIESARLLPASDLQEFVEAEPEAIGAVGEEAATAFDFDIAL